MTVDEQMQNRSQGSRRLGWWARVLAGLWLCGGVACGPETSQDTPVVDEVSGTSLSEEESEKVTAAEVTPLRLDFGLAGRQEPGEGATTASYYFVAYGLPWQAQVNTCIGGAYCGGNESYIDISLPLAPHINYVVVYAHDNIGQGTTAHLIMYVDGIMVGRQDVLKAGSYLRYPVNRRGSLLRFQSVDAIWPRQAGSNETFVGNIQIY